MFFPPFSQWRLQFLLPLSKLTLLLIFKVIGESIGEEGGGGKSFVCRSLFQEYREDGDMKDTAENIGHNTALYKLHCSLNLVFCGTKEFKK